MHYTGDIKKFIKIMAIFLLPIAAFVGLAVFFSFYIGELAPLGKIIGKQAGAAPYLFARGVAERETVKYKYLSLEARQPDILALGSSRVLEFRQEMFGQGSGFYNAGSMVDNLNDLNDYIDKVAPAQAPKVVILGLDVWWFDAERNNRHNFLSELAKPEEMYNWKAYLYSARHFFIEFVKDPRYLVNILRGVDPFAGRQALGYDALEHGNGFRNDGSRQYATYIRAMRKDMAYMDREDSPFADRVRGGENPFSLTGSFSGVSVGDLDRFLTKSQELGIEVIGLAPMFSQEVYNAMASSQDAPILKAFIEEIPPVFAKHGFSYFDFSNLASAGFKDVYMLDGVHPTETGVGQMLDSILDQTCKKGIIIDCQKIHKNLVKVLNDTKTTPAEMNFDTF